jgi:hypothetical protein
VTDEPVTVQPIPRDGLLLHTGPPKTGSTAIQIALHSQRAALAEHGVHLAGRGYRPRRAGWAVLGISPAVGRPPVSIDTWQSLADECRRHGDVRVCVSNETFARADDAAVERIVHDLGADRIHLVHVVRRLDRLLPSSWQERIKAKLTLTYAEWLKVILAEPSDRFDWTSFWQSQDLRTFLERWQRLLPPDRITLICADETNRTLLPGTFESLLDLPRGLLDSDPTKSNRGLTANEAELLRRVNLVAREEQWTPREYLRFAQQGVNRGFRRRPAAAGAQPLPSVPSWAAARVGELSADQVSAIFGSGARVVGDPRRLLVDASAVEARPEEPVTSIDIDTAVTAVLGAIHGGRVLAAEEMAEAVKVRRSRGRRPDEAQVAELSSRQLARVIAARVKRRLARG